MSFECFVRALDIPTAARLRAANTFWKSEVDTYVSRTAFLNHKFENTLRLYLRIGGSGGQFDRLDVVFADLSEVTTEVFAKKVLEMRPDLEARFQSGYLLFKKGFRPRRGNVDDAPFTTGVYCIAFKSDWPDVNLGVYWKYLE